MKYKSFMTIALGAATLLTACNTPAKKETDNQPLIEKQSVKAENGLMTPEILYSFGRVSDPQIAPNNHKILYGVTYIGIKENKSNRELFTMNLDGTDKKQITHTPESEDNAVWFKNGTKIAYLSTKSGSSQIWEMNPDGSDPQQVSNEAGDILSFKISPDGQKILYIKNVKHSNLAKDYYKDLDKSTGKIIDDLMYKHWNQWIEEIPHPFVATFDGEKMAANGKDILEGQPYECPMLPFGGIEQLDWSTDSKEIAYTCRKKTGMAYALSTNSDIYLYDLATQKTTDLTEGMMGYDTNPLFSPDGKQIAWLSMEHDGYESDKNRLFVMDLATKQKKEVTKNFDYNTDCMTWNTDCKSLYLVSCVEAKTQLFKADINKQEVTAITSGMHDYKSCALVGNKLIALRESLSKPDEIYSVDIASGKATELSFENKEILSQLTMGNVEERWIPTTDGKKMLTWVIYPPHFDAKKKYPAILYCEGGPQSPVSQFWSYRWNLQMMAANGYIIVAPNRRGVPGFGHEWLEQISGDYGGQNMKDYFSAIDNVSKEPFVDANRLGCTGASYGGFSVYWIAGHHNKRFKAFYAHAGIFNLEAQYLETEESWFANWDLGGAYWDKNKIAQRSYANSPHRFVDKWDTPIMISTGEHDYRILCSQGMQAFNAAKLRGIPTRLLIYPDECHWITQPQNGILFQREFFRWFDTYLKKK